METNLEEPGWEQRTVTDEFRVNELVEFYHDLGFETKVKNYSCDKKESDICNSCLLVNPEKYKVIFTKVKESEI